MSSLFAKLEARSAHVVICGAGYVGLPLAVEFALAGFSVSALDTDGDKVASLNRGERYIDDVPEAAFRAAFSSGKLRATTRAAVLGEADAVVICVPTPLTTKREPDIQHIVAAVDEIARYQHPGMIVSLESTTFPGTTEEVIAPKLGARYAIGTDVFVAYSPQRIDPGNPDFGPRNTPKVIAGVTPACLEAALALYRTVVDTLVPVSSPTTAEMVKLLENTFRAVNIGLVNELAVMSRALGVDPFEVVRAAATKPYGFMPFYPGPGVGGHCIALDPLYLSWRVAQLGQRARFVELADSVNRGMPDHVVARLASALAERARSLEGAKVLVYGASYKRGVADTRESPVFPVLHGLRSQGADVSYMDPLVPELHGDGLELRSVDPESSFAGYDAVVVLTDHASLNRQRLVEQAPLVLDTRDALRGVPAPRGRVVRL
jgi:UDP-N-acetyl-D-glucosamine dehydrogenase